MATDDTVCANCAFPRRGHHPYFREDKTKPLGLEPTGYFCPMELVAPHSSAIWVFEPKEW